MNIAASSQNVRTPGLGFGLGQLELGKERYWINGGGVTAIPLYKDDIVTIVDPEGLQPVLLSAFDHNGKSITKEFGQAPVKNGKANNELLQKTIADNSSLASSVLINKLSAHNIHLKNAEVSALLEGETEPNTQVRFASGCDALVIFAAAKISRSHAYSHPHYDLPATDLLLFVERSGVQSELIETLPDPLADPSQDICVLSKTASSYEVKAGEYVQIIDVFGRQCSDLQCFDAESVQKGNPRCIDMTSTRSATGSIYPGPGLYAKFYDQNFEPMIEVIQDTCGRHDNFGTACNAKYYEDQGYFGHANCSDNFNTVLDPYGIEKRKSWMAMNLFFNTFFDDDHQFLFDDPWSRPGDFIVFRALKDLVCISSACPCDIDPANAWNPTDIHVRVYPEKNIFKRAIAFRKTTDAGPEMTKETGFHPRTSELTRNFTEYNGFWLANSFNNLGATKEYWRCREEVIMTDLSPLRKYEVLGPDAELLMQTCVTRDVRKLAIGQVVYTAMCYESGGMIDDGTVFRLGKDQFRWIGGCDSSGLWLRQQAEERGLKAWVKDATSEINNLQVQGPKSREVLKDIFWTRDDQSTVAELGWFRFSIARLGDEHGVPVMVSRTGYTGELGFEIFCHPDNAVEVWDAVWQAGQAHNIAPLGLEALDMLRVEAGLIFAGYEFCDQTDPYEAGIAFTVPLKSKEEDFIGRESLLRRSASPHRKLVGLELKTEELASHGEGVFIGRNQVGEITSGSYSPILQKNIALARLDITASDIGKELEVGKLDGHQKRIPAMVVSFPHFDPTKKRVRGDYSTS